MPSIQSFTRKWGLIDDVYVAGGNVVLNAYGHLLNLAMPADYGDSGPWSLNTLPILPQKWEWKVKAEHQQSLRRLIPLITVQFAVIIGCAGI